MSPAPWVAHFGLKRTPFGKSIAASDLFARSAHAEAVARVNFCVAESALGVITGDVGAGKTVSVRAAVAGLDPTRHQIIYVANPAFGTRGLYVAIVKALGAEPRYLRGRAHGPGRRPVGRRGGRAPPPGGDHRRPMPTPRLCRRRVAAGRRLSPGGLRDFEADLIVGIVTDPPRRRVACQGACSDPA